MAPAALLVAEHLCKTYGSRTVLKDAGLNIRVGEIHALLGQNGSGKSTMLGMLAGQVTPDRSAPATMSVDGVQESLPITAERAAELGVAFVPQELALVHGATVTESLGLGHYLTTRLGRVRWARQRQYTTETLNRFGLTFSPDALISSLTEVERAMLAIVRGVESLPPNRPGVLVLDEPTAYLPADAVNKVFDVLRRIAQHGSSVVLVTHRLDEVMKVCDRATVLLGGSVVKTCTIAETTKQELVTAILGVEMDELYPDLSPPTSGEIALAVDGLNGGRLRGLSFEVRPGEILGLTGLVGGGFEDVVHQCFGAVPGRGSGTVTFGGASYGEARLNPERAMANGAAFIPSDRRRAGGVMAATALENITMADLGRFSRLGRLRHRRLRESGIASMADVEVTPLAPDLPFARFSGGNQQKMIFAKWLRRNPRVLLLHEPTHGVDIGAKRRLFSLIQAAAAEGAAVVIASAEYEDLAHLCHRVLVVHDGLVETELRDRTLTVNNILQACLVKSDAAS